MHRALDPLLSVFTGVLAYRLYESNPRTAVPPDQTLSELVKWKYMKWKRTREERLGSDDDGFSALVDTSKTEGAEGSR